MIIQIKIIVPYRWWVHYGNKFCNPGQTIDVLRRLSVYLSNWKIEQFRRMQWSTEDNLSELEWQEFYFGAAIRLTKLEFLKLPRKFAPHGSSPTFIFQERAVADTPNENTSCIDDLDEEASKYTKNSILYKKLV